MSRIRVVSNRDLTTVEDKDFAQECREILDTLLAHGATVMVFLTESDKGQIIKSVPASPSLQFGSIANAMRAYEEFEA